MDRSIRALAEGPCCPIGTGTAAGAVCTGSKARIMYCVYIYIHAILHDMYNINIVCNF